MPSKRRSPRRCVATSPSCFSAKDIADAGGVFKTTGGLVEEFGKLRVRDTPISEQAILGAAAGAAMTGLKPIARNYVFGLFCRVLGYRRQSDCQDALHD